MLLLAPFTVFVLWLSWPAVSNSWAVLEGSPDPGGLPRYPIRTAILVGFGLLLLQGLARIPGLLAVWRGGGGVEGWGAPGQDEPAVAGEEVQGADQRDGPAEGRG